MRAPAPIRIEVHGGRSIDESVRWHSVEARDSAGTSSTIEGTPGLDIGERIGVEVGYAAPAT